MLQDQVVVQDTFLFLVDYVFRNEKTVLQKVFVPLAALLIS